MKLSIVVPAHNEEENIADTIKKIEDCIRLPFELVIVNDHSLDDTAGIVRQLQGYYNNIKLVDNRLDKGFANAIRTGFDNAAAEAVVSVMADLCDDLATVEKMLAKIEEGYDVVCGCRYVKGGRRVNGSKVKGFLSCFAGWSLYFLLGVPTRDAANAFKMYKRTVLESIKIESSGFEISMEILLKAYYQGFKISEVPTVWKERTKGRSNFKILRLLPNYLKLYIWAIYRRLLK